jgi:tetratricopeptide (TPR) repeat protein
MATIFAYIFLLISTQADVSEVNHLFEVGNSFYEKGEYTQAIENYEAALEKGYINSVLYYNLGNSYFKNSELGNAILNYERAKQLDPRDPDIQFNLEIANLFVVDKIKEIPPHLFAKIWNVFANLVGTNQLSIIVLVFYILAISLLIIKLVIRKSPINRISRLVFFPSLIICICISALFFIRLNSEAQNQGGVVMVEKVEVKNSPSPDASEAFALHEGTKINILESSGNYFKIMIADGNIGWLPKEAASVI